MQTTLQQLEDRGAVERGSGTGRGRAAQLQLTPAGRELLTYGHNQIAEVDQWLLADVPDPKRAALVEVLFRAPAAAGRRLAASTR